MTTRFGSTLGWLAIPVVAAALLLPGLLVGPSLDAAVFLVAGWRVTQGDLLYADVWDHKPPGVHFVHALGELLPILDPWAAVWGLTLVATVLTAVLVTRILRQYVRGTVAMLAGLGCTIGLAHFVLSLGGGLSESFAVLPATAGLSLSSPGQRTWKHGALAGLLTGMAAIVSPQFAPAGLACLALLARSERAYRPMVAFVAAGLGTLIGLIGLLALGGILPVFVDAVVSYNAAYRGSASGASSGPAYGLLPWVTLSLVFLLAPAVAGTMAVRRRDRRTQLVVGASLVWIAGSAVLTLIQGRLYGHYALSIVAPLAVLAALGLDDAWTSLRTRSRRRMAGGVLGLLTLLSLGIGAVGAGMELQSIEPSNRNAHAAAESLASVGHGAGPILVWGNEPYLYRLSNRDPATRYVYLYPLTTDGYATPEMVQGVLAELEANPPQVVVDAGSLQPGAPGFLPLLVDRPVATDGRDLDLLDPIRAFVRQQYVIDGDADGWITYRLAREP